MRNERLCGAYQFEVQELTGYTDDELAGYRCTRPAGHRGTHWTVLEGICLAEWGGE